MGLIKSVGAAFGFGGRQGPSTFETRGEDVINKSQQAINKLAAEGDKDITGVTTGGQAEIDLAKLSNKELLDKLLKGDQSRLASGLSQQAITGGLGTGASERLTRGTQQEGARKAQEASTQIEQLIANITGSNIGEQEQFGRQIRFAIPQLQSGQNVTQLGFLGAAGQAQALRDASRQSKRKAFGQIIGGGQGPLSQAGGTIFGAFG